MSLLNCKAVNFNDIRVIFCINGFYIDEEFQVMEIGFWSRNISGVIPFFNKKCYSKLTHKDRMSVNYLTYAHHGLNLTNKFDKSLSQSEVVSCLKSIYQICSDENDSRIYIGYMNDNFFLNIAGKAGLGNLIVNIDKMYDEHAPSNEVMMRHNDYGKAEYKPCFLHQKIENDKDPHCAKVKAKFLADFCSMKEKDIGSNIIEEIQMNL